jgi:hypothetical protein
MKACSPRLLSAILVTLLSAAVSRAGTASGTVLNRTTGKPAANVELSLVDLQAGMAEVATAKSDAQGHFTFNNDGIGRGPMLVRAVYQGVTFNTALPPGRPSADVDVYEVSKDQKLLTIASHIVIFQPQGEKLIGAEENVIQNTSQPQQAFFRSEGDFEFAIPEKATLQQISTVSSTGMSVQQAPIDKGKGRNAIAYAFRPGETSIRLSYEIAYPGSATSVKLTAVYPGVKMLVVAPPGVTITGDGLTQAGQEQGMMLYAHQPLDAKAGFTVSVSGVGAPQAADAGAETSAGAGGPQGRGMPQEGNSRTQGPDVQAVPGRLNDLKWPLLIGFGALFALAAILLSRKQVVVAHVPAEEHDAPVTATSRKKSPKPQAAPAPDAAASVAAVNAQVNSSLDSLKDQVFRLELRKQAGTISDAEYASEKERVEKLLRDLVRG